MNKNSEQAQASTTIDLEQEIVEQVSDLGRFALGTFTENAQPETPNIVKIRIPFQLPWNR